MIPAKENLSTIEFYKWVNDCLNEKGHSTLFYEKMKIIKRAIEELMAHDSYVKDRNKKSEVN